MDKGEHLEEFDKEIFKNLIESITIFGNGTHAEFKFKCGIHANAQIPPHKRKSPKREPKKAEPPKEKSLLQECMELDLEEELIKAEPLKIEPEKPKRRGRPPKNSK